MFESARLKLTAWYLLMIMLISIFFSVAFYHVGTNEIERLINRIEFHRQYPDEPIPDRPAPPPDDRGGPNHPTLEELIESKRRLAITLVIINAGIFLIAGGAAYFLAGRTLRPIKEMIDDQKLFISNASHELRTPIAVMRAEMEGSLLEKQISDKHARELITSNLEELSELQNLTNNMLQLAKVHNTKKGKYAELVKLKDVLTSAQKKITALAKKKQLTLVTNTTDAVVLGDSNQLREVFVILLENAIKYSNEKTKIAVIFHQTKNSIAIAIEDQGVGISPKDLPHIFERFYRAEESRTADGYGLGLAIAKRTVELHNGSISVISKEDSGTTFTVTLPLRNTTAS